MIVFESAGLDNTEPCVAIAAEKAASLGLSVVVASSSGATALSLVSALKSAGARVPVIAVRGVFGYQLPNGFRMSGQTENDLLMQGVKIVSAAHALSGAERSLSTKFHGVYPVEIVAYTLRMFGQGTKVCVECAAMALDAGLVEYGKPVICVGGTGGGADTCVLLTPCTSQQILQTKIHEIYCKPHL